MAKKILSAVLFLSVVITLSVVSFQDAIAAYMDIWTATSYEEIGTTSAKPGGATTTITWDAARNEYESAQIVLRSDSGFSINSVSFTNLTSGGNSISSGNLKYNFVVLDPAGLPDILLNDTSISVSANTAQAIWITVYVPKQVAAGAYTGTVTVETTVGNYNASINLEVYDVTIPDPGDSEYNITNWSWTAGRFNNTPANDQIEIQYGYDRYSTEWWDLMDEFAKSMKEHRINQFLVQTMDLLIDGGTTLNNGIYTFNWSKFDELVQYFIDRGVVKTLEGTHLGYRTGDFISTIGVCTLQKDAQGNLYQSLQTIGSDEADNWLCQFLPVLKSHLQTKGWFDIWYQHIVDEPYTTTQKDNWISIWNSMDTYASGMKSIDALVNHSQSLYFEGKLDVWVPIEDIYENNQSYYNGRKTAGDELWYYTTDEPNGNYLNRNSSMEVWRVKLMSWWAYKRGITGFLHWGWNQWAYSYWDGNTYIVHPDSNNGTIKNTMRHDAMRDGAEEYELFKILEASNPGLASTIVNNVITSATSYTTSISTMINNRKDLIMYAAEGAPLPVPIYLLDDFNAEITGQPPAGYVVGDSTLVTVQEVPSATDKSMYINNTSGYSGNLAATKSFTEQTSGTLTTSLKFKLSQPNTNVSLAYLNNSSGTAAVCVFWDAGSGKLMYVDGNTYYNVPNAAVNMNTWYTLKTVSNITNGTFDIYFEDMATPKVTGAAFRNFVTSLAMIQCQVNDKPGADVSAYYDDINVSTGPISRWRFEDNGNDSAGSNNLTIKNGAAYSTACMEGSYSLLLDSADDYAEVADNPTLDLTGALTLSAWVKIDSLTSNNSGVIAKYQGPVNQRSYNLYISSTGKAGFVLSSDGTYNSGYVLEGSTTLDTGRWYHIAAKYEPGSLMKVYVDGLPDGSKTSGVPLLLHSGSAPLWIGAQYNANDPDALLDGLIDDARIYNRALSDPEIAGLVQ